MNVGLNLLFLHETSGGTGTYVRELIPAMIAAEPSLKLTAFVGRRVPPSLLEEPWSGEVEWLRRDVLPEQRRTVLSQLVAMPITAARRRLDLVHSPANVGPVLTYRTARVVTLLDVIWLHEGEQAGLSGWVLTTTRLQSLASARRADRIIAISQWAKQDLAETVGLKPERIAVTPLAVRPPQAVADEAELRARHDLGEGPIVLSVAQKRPYKNLDKLIRALPDLHGDVRLVLPGAPTPHEDDLRGLAKELGVAERVRFLSWTAEEELAGLYRAASCFVLASRMEGFGLPVLEAMQAGTPVACANRASLPEIAGDAALLFDPDDQSTVTEAVRRLLVDEPLRTELARRGRERVREFTWERTAAATLAAYRAAIDSRTSR